MTQTVGLQRRAFRLSFGRIVLAIALLFLTTQVIAGPLRYFISKYEFSFIIYIPTFLGIFICIGLPIIRFRISKVHFLIFLMILMSMVIGLASIGNISQVFFGAYIFMPLFLGIISYPYIYTYRTWFSRFVKIMLYIAVGGVFVDYFINLPWEGSVYFVSDYSIVISRAWSTAGIQRLAGFSRASFSVATEILFLWIFLQFQSQSRTSKMIVWFLVVISLALTTSKAVFLGILIISLFLISYRVIPKYCWRVFILIFGFCFILLPTLSLILQLDYKIDSPIYKFGFSSLYDRFINTWPEAFSQLQKISVIFGRGIGGIGTPQKIFESMVYNPGDNLFVYLYSIFGILSVILLVLLIFGFSKLNFLENDIDHNVFLIGLAIMSIGLTSNVLEEPFAAFFLGIALQHLSKKVLIARNLEYEFQQS